MNPSSAAEKKLLEIAKARAKPDLEQVRELLPNIQDINLIDPRGGFTALHWATFNGHDELVTLLVEEAGANTNAISSAFVTAAFFAGTNFGTNSNVADQFAMSERQNSIYRYLMRKGAAYHKLDENSPPENETFRERWFGESSDAWKRWSERRDVTQITPLMLAQFTSHGTAHQALEPSLWKGHEAQLRTLLTNPDIAPCHLDHWLEIVPGLRDIIHQPQTIIHDWTIAQTPQRNSASRG